MSTVVTIVVTALGTLLGLLLLAREIRALRRALTERHRLRAEIQDFRHRFNAAKYRADRAATGVELQAAIDEMGKIIEQMGQE